MISSKKLEKFKNIKHGFFNRNGGRSTGVYKSLNCGIDSSDKKKNVLENLKIVCKKINCSPKKLVLLHQAHSNKFSFIDEKYKFANKKIKADALITKNKNVAIGVLTADCIPILIYDQKLQIISAIHAGWKGAYKGIIKKVDQGFVIVDLAEEVEGLLKANEISLEEEITDARTIFKEDDEVEVKITAIDRRKRTINLSIKAKESDDEQTTVNEYAPETGGNSKLGDILKEHLESK